MSNEFENKVLSYIQQEKLFDKGAEVLVAFSGGADSAGLLNALFELKKAGLLDINIGAIHVNHNLRGKLGDADQNWCRDFCISKGIEYHESSVDVNAYAANNKLSTETAGRQLRRAELIKTARQNNYDCVTLGHHKDDNAETIIDRLSRGTGFRGLCGIRPEVIFEQVRFVRPLLGVSRLQIEAYCKNNGIEFRRDHTNQDINYRRNYIRHRLLPYLCRKREAEITNKLAELSRKCRQMDSTIETAAQQAWNHVATIENPFFSLKKRIFANLSQPVAVAVIRKMLLKIGCGERDITESHYAKIIALTQAQTGTVLELPGGFKVTSDYTNLIFEPVNGQKEVGSQPFRDQVRLKVPGEAVFGDMRVETRVIDSENFDFELFLSEKNEWMECFDMDKVKGDLLVRERKEGDRMQVLGMKGTKQVADIVSDCKSGLYVRKNAFVVQDSEKIIWTVPLRISEKSSVESSTKRLIFINFHKKQ